MDFGSGITSRYAACCQHLAKVMMQPKKKG
jgi:hypothetical protein